MDRINHVKIVSPDPAAVREFLTEVLDIPDGWELGQGELKPAPAEDPDAPIVPESVFAGRDPRQSSAGFIVGSPESRQLQIFQADEPRIWAIAVGTRDLEGAYERCVERGFSCTEPTLTPWSEHSVRYFFARAGGITFEVMRVESSA